MSETGSETNGFGFEMIAAKDLNSDESKYFCFKSNEATFTC